MLNASLNKVDEAPAAAEEGKDKMMEQYFGIGTGTEES